jgi:hypothetical protein
VFLSHEIDACAAVCMHEIPETHFYLLPAANEYMNNLRVVCRILLDTWRRAAVQVLLACRSCSPAMVSMLCTAPVAATPRRFTRVASPTPHAKAPACISNVSHGVVLLCRCCRHVVHVHLAEAEQQPAAGLVAATPRRFTGVASLTPCSKAQA